MASNPGAVDLKREFRSALAALGAARRATPWPSAPGKALELWLMFRIAEDLKASGWSVTLQNGAGRVLGRGAAFVSRAQPGRIPAASAPMPGFILLRKPAGLSPAEEFELHGSLQYRGRSRACHELDISILPASVGRAIRTRGGGRPTGIPPLAVECKHHKSPGGLGEAREKVARLFDLTYVWKCFPRNGQQIFWPSTGSAVGWGRRYYRYKDQNRAGLYGIARSSGFQTGARQLLRHFELEYYPDVIVSGGLHRLLADVRNQFP